MKIMVAGAGQMGQGIAQILAAAGHTTLLNNLDHTPPERGLEQIAMRLTRASAKGLVSPDSAHRTLSHLTPSHRLQDAGDCDMVFEALAEDEAVKKSVLGELDRCCGPRCIFATNTSSLPIARLAAATNRPDRVIGMHFMNPVPRMKLVEVIPGPASSQDTIHTVFRLAKELGKTPVCVRDVPGFVSNRVLQALISESIWCVYEGVGSAEAVDTIMKLGMNHPMGPLETADLIGLDTVLSIQQTMYEGYHLEKYRPCPLLCQYVKNGWLGKKAGRGFYRYEEKGAVNHA